MTKLFVHLKQYMSFVLLSHTHRQLCWSVVKYVDTTLSTLVTCKAQAYVDHCLLELYTYKYMYIAGRGMYVYTTHRGYILR